MVRIPDNETESVSSTTEEQAPVAKPKGKAKPKAAKPRKVVELPADTVVDEDEPENVSQGETEAPAEAEDAPAEKPKVGPVKVDMSNKEAPKPVEFVECEWCGKKVKKGGLGKHVANLAGDGIHPFKEELEALRDAGGSTTTDNLEAEDEGGLEPWMIALGVGILALIGMVLFFIFTTKKNEEQAPQQTVTVQTAPAVSPPVSTAPVQHVSEPAMVEDQNGNQIPVNVVRNADGTYSAAP